MAARWGHPKQRAQAPMQLRQSSELTRAPHHEGSSPLAAKELSTAYTMPRVAPHDERPRARRQRDGRPGHEAGRHAPQVALSLMRARQRPACHRTM